MRHLKYFGLVTALCLGLSAFAADTIVQPLTNGAAPAVLLAGGKLAPVQIVMTTDGAGNLTPAANAAGDASSAAINAKLPPATGLVQAFGRFVASGPVSNGETATVTIGAHQEVVTFVSGAPANGNESSLAGDPVQNFANALTALFAVSELTAVKENPTTVLVTAGTNFPGTAGNGVLRLQEASGLTVSNVDGSGYAQNGTSGTSALASQATLATRASEATLSALNAKFSSYQQPALYSVTGAGAVVEMAAAPAKYFSIQVNGVGGTPTAWDVRLECSLDGLAWTQVVQHTNADGIGTTKPLATAFPCLKMRANVAGLTLAPASSIGVGILGLQ